MVLCLFCIYIIYHVLRKNGRVFTMKTEKDTHRRQNNEKCFSMIYKNFMNLYISVLHMEKEWCIIQLPNIGNSS